MADIAVAFHWTPDVMEAMTVTDLSFWRAKARQCSGVEE